MALILQSYVQAALVHIPDHIGPELAAELRGLVLVATRAYSKQSKSSKEVICAG